MKTEKQIQKRIYLLEMEEVQLEASTESRLFFKTKEKMKLERIREQIKTLNWILS